MSPTNFYASGATAASYAGEDTDFIKALDDLQVKFPACTTVSLIISWFFDSLDASVCKIYPSTTYLNPAGALPHVFEKWNGSAFVSDTWRVSGLTEASAGVIPITASGGKYSYGGTPSDQSVVRAIQEIKARGLRVIFYPFLLGDPPDRSFPWRGRISYSPDKSSAATNAVNAFFGSADVGDFTRDLTNLTVSYAGSPTDFSYRRMILHYANLVTIAGGVDLFIVGSELRGLEPIRGPAWTKAGQVDGSGHAYWDYPFATAINTLVSKVTTVFTTYGCTPDPTTTKTNLIGYTADWSSWMGWQHPGEDGQWPHLDQVFSNSQIHLVCIDNYMPMSDWTTGLGGLDVYYWSAAKYTGSWPPGPTQMHGLGLTGEPTIYSKDYLKANIEGGEKFNWFYGNSNNGGRGFDPLGTGAQISCPEGDRLTQTRSQYYSGQELLANKQLRWWWGHTHKAIYDTGSGWQPQGPNTGWTSQMKPIVFTEYGVPSCDKGTNQPNVFFDPKSVESDTPYWSEWAPAFGGAWVPKADVTLGTLALQALHEYWFVDGNNATSISGQPMIDQDFCCAWAWDARPFPTFPQKADVWGDTPNWRAGHWIAGKGPFLPPGSADPSPAPGSWPAFPVLVGLGWSIRYSPINSTIKADYVSGRSSRAARTSAPLLQIELTYDILRHGNYAELATLAGFYMQRKGGRDPFTIAVPVALGYGTSVTARFEDDSLDLEEFMANLWRGESVKIMQVRGE
jgi:hypothetical protein